MIQSSSATTVIVVGLVNAGIMTLRQAVGVIMGANIGTTVTAQLIRLSDIQSDSFLLQLFKPATLAPLAAVIGIVLYMASKGVKKRELGQMLVGFGILFSGMFAMEAAVRPLQSSETLPKILTAMSQNPVLGVLAGCGDHRCDSEFGRLDRYVTGSRLHRNHQLRSRLPDHHGTEYRHLHYPQFWRASALPKTPNARP